MKTIYPILFCEGETSNFPHDFLFVIQGFDNSIGRWRDSKYGGSTAEEAIENSFKINYISKNTKLRVVRSKK